MWYTDTYTNSNAMTKARSRAGTDYDTDSELTYEEYTDEENWFK